MSVHVRTFAMMYLCMLHALTPSSHLSRSVDVYSFSMIFFYMLRGQPPFLSLDGVQAAKAAAIEKARPNIPTSATFAPPLAELLRTTWCDVPSERLTFQQVSEQPSTPPPARPLPPTFTPIVISAGKRAAFEPPSPPTFTLLVFISAHYFFFAPGPNPNARGARCPAGDTPGTPRHRGQAPPKCGGIENRGAHRQHVRVDSFFKGAYPSMVLRYTHMVSRCHVPRPKASPSQTPTLASNDRCWRSFARITRKPGTAGSRMTWPKRPKRWLPP